MAGSSFGTIFRLTTWGESHGKGVGVVVDGVPAGLSLSEEDIQVYLDRRKPGQNRFTTKRKESDTVHWYPVNGIIRSPHLKFCFAKGGLFTPESLSYAAKQ